MVCGISRFSPRSMAATVVFMAIGGVVVAGVRARGAVLMTTMKKAGFGLLAGLIFGVGLAISGMTDTSKAIGFQMSGATGSQRWPLSWPAPSRSTPQFLPSSNANVPGRRRPPRA